MSSRPTSTRPASAAFAQRRPPTGGSYARPWTGQSRPGTARAVSSRGGGGGPAEGSFIVAVIESRGIGREVGVAALDRDTGMVDLIQLADCQTYVKTLHHISLHNPALVLVPDTSLSHTDASAPVSGKFASNTSLLVQCIQDEFMGVPVEPVLRKYWNEEAGLQFVSQLCVDSDDRAATLLAVSSKYYALSAACAVFKHAEMRLNTRYSAHSLRIRYTSVEGTMLIDNDTARNLELVGNMMNRKSIHSLFGALNHTWTAMGARLLRMNLLAPLTGQSSIEARLDAVEEFVQAEDKFSAVRDALKTINKLDLDKLIAVLVATEARESSGPKIASIRVSQMLQLRSIVKNIPIVRDAVRGCHSRLMEIVCEMLSDERIERISELISQSLNEDVQSQKGGGLAAMNAKVYAVKVNYNCLLDVARETYRENIADIFQLHRSLSETHGLPIQLVHQTQGFIFTLRKTDLEEAGMAELPKGFVNATERKGKWFFESIDLKKRNARMKDALDETLMLSNKIIQDLVVEVIVEIGALYKASEALALLDMIWSFAHSSILRNYVRPEFAGTLAIKGGRHPILETIRSAGTIVPNDVYCCDTSSFQIIQGPNMSGKSTYLRQIGLLTVMAMCGCFVPVEYASFRTHDALLTRLSNDDDIERNLSTFAEEMSSSAMILGLSSPASLILIDELGRGTSPREGLGISHAIAEQLIKTRAFVFFATHFSELSNTLSRQPTVVNLHLSVQQTRPSASNIGLIYHYKIMDGVPDNIGHYGLELARLADLPEDVLTEAQRVATRLTELEERQKQSSESIRITTHRKALLRLRTQLTQAFEHSALPDEDLLEYLARLQKEVAQVLGADLDDNETYNGSITPSGSFAK